MAQIMTTRELAKYLKLHEITICKYAVEGRIPAIRIGRVWRFDKDAIDEWDWRRDTTAEQGKAKGKDKIDAETAYGIWSCLPLDKAHLKEKTITDPNLSGW